MRLGDRQDRVGQRGHGQGSVVQPREGSTYLGVRWQCAHRVDHAAGVVVGQRRAGPVGEHPQRRVLRRGEVDVLAGQAADERQLQHLGEPLRPHRRVAEEILKRAVERAQIEQGFVDVERNH
jgi:hypothetical protein